MAETRDSNPRPHASGSVTVLDTGGAAQFYAKLWDGATVIAEGAATQSAANFPYTFTLSGFKPKPEVRKLLVQLQPADPSTGFPREIEVCHWILDDGDVVLTDDRGAAIKGERHKLKDGDDPIRFAKVFAWQHCRKKRGGSDFNRRLTYGPLGAA